jgi:hypothetical protein
MMMKRRTFGLLAGTSMAALKLGRANAQTAGDPALLATTLTPLGGERVGNADGSIPSWTGGYTTVPSGWDASKAMPDPFAGEQALFVIDASNVAQHADKLADGVVALITKVGFSVKVYPTHRSQAAPQSVYDNTAKNVTRCTFIDPNTPQDGFTGGFGGVPFPIPDTSNPPLAGAQIIYNHLNRWAGFAYRYMQYGYVVSGGQLVWTLSGDTKYDYPYYYRQDAVQFQQRELGMLVGPPNLAGQGVVAWYYTDDKQGDVWELLNGQARVRKAPEISYDTPSNFANGVIGYDEYYGFNSNLTKYDWKYLGKKEMYIPYNNNGMYLLKASDVLKAKFCDPNVVRWELHRVWVVEATLRAGKRNVLARRRFYVDEDNWTVAVTDAWDADGNLYKNNQVFNYLRPDLPGVVQNNCAIYNLQTGDYSAPGGSWDELENPKVQFHDSWPDSTFDPENMAASGQY